ncbi:hypothetical protein C7974DRAFT_426350 [Boeremia exigua]|uniref:uncharacterized protein n=1 Tax=Boeremia exigua TaxID=749465 RepID=UPI001E8E7B2F|nr:uncharacterized protein C7974DRAFT_426350 [Boeremia exigua]KAH6620142.1 hypothetical protein C7974DRAFT_426350 [Boeremia exigua]
MSTHTPLRIARTPAHSIRRQCLFQRRPVPSTPRCLAAAPARAFSSTPAARHRKDVRLYDPRMQLAGASKTIWGHPAPSVRNGNKSLMREMADDIGLLQNTIIRARFRDLPRPTSWEFYSYFWALIKAKATAVYTRSHFNRCAHKKGAKSYLPIDFLNQKQLKDTAKNMYTRYYEALASADTKALRDLCLTPLANAARTQINARGVKVSWQLLKFKSARIVSHRCSPLGGEYQDTSYRQCVVRLESEQQLTVVPIMPRAGQRSTGGTAWAPGAAPKQKAAGALSAESEDVRTETVVEYVVLQTRVMEGKLDEEWKLWGFTTESTPARIEEDEAYWRKMLDMQTQAA